MKLLYVDGPDYYAFTPHDYFVFTCWGIAILIMFLLRNTPLGFLWYLFKIFVIILVATIFADQVKKYLKEWWNKD